ncbi:MFS transporter [Klebsiella aerogenes]|uniref:MFS transporter n=1 Tax=Klebsiella aerogenes TaxID=548 RepID=UPI0028930A56|nr:MFS transporter [Klebsiella aerogenes]
MTINLRRMGAIIAFIQFTNALEYMIFNPLFVYMAPTFQVPVSWAGYVSGIYTLASVISGIGAWRLVGKLNPRKFLLVNMALLGALTLMVLATQHFILLLILRFLAGLLGGMTMGVASSLLINAADQEHRARLLATVISAFSLVSIIGMPAMLFLCERFGWQTAPALIGVLCLVALFMIYLGLPNIPGGAGSGTKIRITPTMLLFASGNALTQFSPMLLLPILVPLLLGNMRASSEALPWLFFLGGMAGFAATKLSGSLCQRFGGYRLSLAATAVFIISLLMMLWLDGASWLFMITFLGASYSRLVASSAVAIRFPDDNWRAGFTTLQGGVMSFSTALAFMLCSLWLADGEMSQQASTGLIAFSGASALLLPFLLRYQEKILVRNAAERATGGVGEL